MQIMQKNGFNGDSKEGFQRPPSGKMRFSVMVQV